MGSKLKEFVPIVFVNNLRQLRQDSGMSISEFADAVGVHYMTVYRWEQGARIPSVPMMVKIANVFDITLEKLFVVE